MAKPILPEDYQDDIPAKEMNGKRRYILTENNDGSYSLEDVTQYTQLGSRFGAGQINNICMAVNQSADQAVIIDDLEDIRANTTEKKIAGALALKQLSSDLDSFEAIKYQDFETISKVIEPHAFVNFSFVASPPDGYSLLGFVNLCVNYPLGVAGDISVAGNTLSGYMGNASNIRYDRALVRGRAVFSKNII